MDKPFNTNRTEWEMDLAAYRRSATEKARVNDLMGLLPEGGTSALDIGARDGFISKLLTQHYSEVTALDLEQPLINDAHIRCVKGDITALSFADGSFDLVFCAEVLEHIPSHLLGVACQELARVTKEHLIVGVPYQQDIRVGRTTCSGCGKVNPPWGHVNSFDDNKLSKLFSGMTLVKRSFVGESSERTNWFSSSLMNLAGNPYGTYSQDEPCIHCGAAINSPQERAIWQKILTKTAYLTMAAQKSLLAPHPNWIHLLLRKQ